MLSKNIGLDKKASISTTRISNTVDSSNSSSPVSKARKQDDLTKTNETTRYELSSYKKLSKDEEKKEVEKIRDFYRSSQAKSMFSGVKVNGKLANTQKDRSIELDKFADDVRAKLKSIKSKYSREEILEVMNKKILENTQPKSMVDTYFSIENKEQRGKFLDNAVKTKLKKDQQMYDKYLEQIKEDSKVFEKADHDHGHDDTK